MGIHPDKRFELRRRNYGKRAEGLINDILVTLDLLLPDHELEQKEHVAITSELSINTEPAITVTVRPDRRLSRQRLQVTKYPIHPETIDALFQHELIRKVRPILGRGTAEPTEIAELALSELLSLHDAMHVGNTLHLKPGIYRHFKGEDRMYSVLGVSTDTEDGTLRVIYQPLHGEHYAKLCNRTLAMFTQVIARDGYLGPRWRIFLPQKVDLITRHGD